MLKYKYTKKRIPNFKIIAFILAMAGMPFIAFNTTAYAQEFHTTSGIKVLTPSIQGLSCLELSEILAEIDATGYRGSAPEPHFEEDQPLFTYETQVTEAHYDQCANDTIEMPNSSEATFKRAFQSADQ